MFVKFLINWKQFTWIRLADVLKALLKCFLAGVVLLGLDEADTLVFEVAAEVVAWDDADDDDVEEWAVEDEDVDWFELSPSDWLIGCKLLFVAAVIVIDWGECSRDEDIVFLNSLFFFKL